MLAQQVDMRRSGWTFVGQAEKYPGRKAVVILKN